MKYLKLNSAFSLSKFLGLPAHIGTICNNYFLKGLITTDQILKVIRSANLRKCAWDDKSSALVVRDGARNTTVFYIPQPGQIVAETFLCEFGKYTYLTHLRQHCKTVGRKRYSLYTGTIVADDQFTVQLSDNMYRVLDGRNAHNEAIETWLTNPVDLPYTGKKKRVQAMKGTVTLSDPDGLVAYELTERLATGLLGLKNLNGTYLSICADKDGQLLHNIHGDVFTDYWHDTDNFMFRIHVRDLNGTAINDLTVHNTRSYDDKAIETIVKDGEAVLFRLNWTELDQL
ncbi:hypothetical protein SM033_00174 [Vibrio phage vB_VpaM_sm033]|nr:hypothetical protein SM033_00174 [Vibrio phage vB_VpaM_sm033]